MKSLSYLFVWHSEKLTNAFFLCEGSTEAAVELRKELATLRLRIESMEGELATKDDDIKKLNILKQQQQQNAAPAEERIKVRSQLFCCNIVSYSVRKRVH